MTGHIIKKKEKKKREAMRLFTMTVNLYKKINFKKLRDGGTVGKRKEGRIEITGKKKRQIFFS